MDEPNADAVLRAAMTVMVIRQGNVDNDVTLTSVFHRPMIFQDSEVEMPDRVDALETAVDDAVDHGLPPEGAKMLHDIVFCTHLDIFRWTLLGDSRAPVEPMTVRL